MKTKTLIQTTLVLFFTLPFSASAEDSKGTRKVEVKGSIGISISGTDFLKINKVFEGKPAWKAGLRTGDRIVSIDDHSMIFSTYEEVLSMIKGKAGETLTITVLTRREGERKTFEVTREDLIYELPAE